MDKINVNVTFKLWNLPTLLIPPDSLNDDWAKFASPSDKTQGIFRFQDLEGDIELLIHHEWAVTIRVYGTVSEEIINNPNPNDKNHQQVITSFYIRAFTLINHFLLRYRFNTFNYRTHPIKWQVWYPPQNSTTLLPTEFIVGTPMKWEVTWDIDIDEEIDLPTLLNFRIKQDGSDSYISYQYSVDALEKTYDEVSALAQGKSIQPKKSKDIKPDQNAYDIAIELLMQAQELVISEQKQRQEERSASVCAALITTAAACEVFVKGFVQTHGTSLHRFLIKGKSLSVENLLHKVLADIPTFGKSLKSFNAELMHNIFLLFQARNSAVHRGKPQITIIQSKDEIKDVDEDTERITTKRSEVLCPIEGWMVYSDRHRDMIYGDVDGEFGTFVWDVLALIEWLRIIAGGQWLKPAVKNYWERQSKFPVKARESEILERTLELRGKGRL